MEKLHKSCSNKLCKNKNPQPVNNFYTNNSAKDKLCYRCKDCSKIQNQRWYANNPDKERKYYQENKSEINIRHREYNKTYSDRRRELNIRRLYNISLEEYNEILLDQNGLCAICNKSENSNKSLAVDHCHNTGNIRGLLCSKCNTAIGLLNDDPELLLKTVGYLYGNLSKTSGLQGQEEASEPLSEVSENIHSDEQ